MKERSPLTKPPTDADGNLLPEDGPPVYIVIEGENGDETFVMSTNIRSTAHLSAQGTSLGESDLFAARKDPILESCRIVDGNTHKALYRYKAGEGLQEGWEETDPDLARCRAEHISSETYFPFPGKKKIKHSDWGKQDSKISEQRSQEP
jgi:hypothetical protein